MPVRTSNSLPETIGTSHPLQDLLQQRQQIATEIHNGPLHTLTAVLLQTGTQPAETALQQAHDGIRHAARALRHIITGLRPPVLQQSIPCILRAVTREFNTRHPWIHLSIHAEIRSGLTVAAPAKAAFFYILTEALNNIHKHAAAAQVTISLYIDDQRLRCIIQDDGGGENIGVAPLNELQRSGQMGIADMHQWAAGCGGRLGIEDVPEGGMAVSFTLPLSPPGAPVCSTCRTAAA